ISHSFVRITAENARREGVAVDVRQGNASALPFEAEAFDFIVTRAAFKNFGDPVGAIREMHRVLRVGGVALILDMRKEASHEAIADEVSKMNLGLVSGFFTRATLENLRKRAYTRDDLTRMVAQTPFGHAAIDDGGIGFEMWMTKSAK